MVEPAGKSRSRKKRSRLKMAAAAGVLALALLSLGAWRIRAPVTYEPDPNAEPVAQGGTRSIGELKEELQSQADESSFRLQLNAKPRVKGDQAELLLGNPAENKLCLAVTIRLDENGEALYESGTLVPGAQVLTARLNRTLPVGEYPATAVCTAIDPETGETVGTPVQASLLLEAVESPSADSTVESAAIPAKESSQAPAKESSSTPAKESSSAPAKESSEASAKESSSAPAKESSSAPAKEPSAAPAKEPSEASAKESSSAPAKESSEALAKESSSAPVKEPSAAPAKE